MWWAPALQSGGPGLMASLGVPVAEQAGGLHPLSAGLPAGAQTPVLLGDWKWLI